MENEWACERCGCSDYTDQYEDDQDESGNRTRYRICVKCGAHFEIEEERNEG